MSRHYLDAALIINPSATEYPVVYLLPVYGLREVRIKTINKDGRAPRYISVGDPLKLSLSAYVILFAADRITAAEKTAYSFLD